ncbi:MAG TPA: hypothetical protein PK867_25810, partial [Pirellulales bacterium]|nr:hypothetical protein [Pirellulales bacterium]
YEDRFGGSDLVDKCGIEPWHEGYPAMYFRGPFLQYMRKCPAQGVDFVVRLINFATARWSEAEAHYRGYRGPAPFPPLEDEGISVPVGIDAEDKKWGG